MKKNSIFLSLMLLVLFVFTACDSTEGTLYQGEKDRVSFLSKATNLDMKGDFLKVPIARTSSEGELTVPVTLASTNSGYTNAFKISGPVIFAAGESKAYVNIDYSKFGTVDPTSLTITPNGFDVDVSLGFPFELKVGNQEMISPSMIGSTSISALSNLEFQDAGKGSIDSSEGWEEDVLENVSYQKAKGVNAYKVIKPFSNYNLAFLIASDGKKVTFPNQVFSPNATYGPITLTISKATYDAEAHAVTVTVSSYAVAAGSFGNGVEVFYLPK